MSYADDDSRAEKVTSPAQVVGLLKNLQNKRTLLTARVDDDPRYYHTALLKIDTEREIIYLDELVPQTGHRLLHSGSQLHIVGILGGVPTHFTVQIVSLGEQDGITFYRASLPEWIDYQQRRAAFRISIGHARNFGVRLSVAEGEHLGNMCSGRLLDISLGGFSALFPESSRIRPMDQVNVYALELPDKVTIASAAQIRYVQSKPRGGHFRAGACFVDLSPTAEQSLWRAILVLEREQLRKKVLE